MLFGPPRLFQLQFTCYFVKLPSYFLPFFPPLLSKFDILIRCFNLKKKIHQKVSHYHGNCTVPVHASHQHSTAASEAPLHQGKGVT